MTKQSIAQIKVRRMLHTVHAVRDVAAARKLYQDVFGGIAFAERYHEGEDRDMALLYVADHMIEPMAPRRPDQNDTTFSRYLSKFGQGLHSFELRIDDAAAAAELCRSQGFALSSVYPTFFFVRPEATGGLVVALCGKPITNDPKEYQGWRNSWIVGHPAGLLRLRHIACVVRDPSPAAAFFETVLNGTLLDWEVEDLDRARRHVERIGMTIAPAHLDREGFAIDPASMLGARHEFVSAA